MSRRWYYRNGADIGGPISGAELKRLADKGEVNSSTLIASEGGNQWRPATQLNGLFPSVANPQIEPPPASTMPPTNSAPPPAAGLSPPGPAPTPAAVPPGMGTTPATTQQTDDIALQQHESIPQLAAAPTTSSGQPGRRVDKRLFAMIATGTLAMVAIGFASFKAGQSQDPVGDSNAAQRVIKQEMPQGGSVDRSHHVPALPPEDNVDLDEKQHELEKKIRKLVDEAEELEEKKDKLQREIEDLALRLDEFRKWLNVDFALLSRSDHAVAIREDTEGRLLVVSKLAGDDGRHAKAILTRLRGYRIDKDDKLTRQVFNLAASGEPVSPKLTDQIRQYWKPVGIFSEPPDASTQYVSFHDVEVNKRRIGIFRGTESRTLRYEVPGEPVTSVEKQQIQEGTARVAAPEQLLTTLSDTDFLDYCVINIAQKLYDHSDEQKARNNGAAVGIATFVNVAVHCEVDIPAETLRHYRSLDKMLEKHAGDRLVTFTKRAGSSSSGSAVFVPWVGGIASGQSSSFDNQDFTDKPITFDVLREREKLFEKHMEPELQHSCEYVEDEVYHKLYEAGIPTVENEGVADADFGDRRLDPVEVAIQHNATHLLRLQLKRPQVSGRYFLSARLINCRTNRHLWSGAGDRAFDTELIGQQYFMEAGRLAVVELNSDFYDQFVGIETPPVVATKREWKKSHLVYVEQQSSETAPMIYRTVYSKRKREIPAEAVKNIQWVNQPDQVPRAFGIRYAVSRILSRMLPPAGRVHEVEGNRATALIGRIHGVNAGDQLLVLRVSSSEASALPVSSQGDGLFAESRTLLPQEVIVTEVFDEHCSVHLSESGLESWYPENAVIRENDIVMRKPSHSIVAGVAHPTIGPAPQSTLNRLQARYRGKGMELMTRDAERTVLEITRLVRNGLQSMTVPVVLANDVATLEKAGCTNIVHCALTLSEETTSPSTAMYDAGFLVRGVNSANQYSDQFTMDFRIRDLLPGR